MRRINGFTINEKISEVNVLLSDAEQTMMTSSLHTVGQLYFIADIINSGEAINNTTLDFYSEERQAFIHYLNDRYRRDVLSETIRYDIECINMSDGCILYVQIDQRMQLVLWQFYA